MNIKEVMSAKSGLMSSTLSTVSFLYSSLLKYLRQLFRRQFPCSAGRFAVSPAVCHSLFPGHREQDRVVWPWAYRRQEPFLLSHQFLPDGQIIPRKRREWNTNYVISKTCSYESSIMDYESCLITLIVRLKTESGAYGYRSHWTIMYLTLK